MANTWYANEQLALHQLLQQKITGVAADLAPDLRRRLAIERLVEADEHGQDRITQHGIERLMRLRSIFGRRLAA